MPDERLRSVSTVSAMEDSAQAQRPPSHSSINKGSMPLWLWVGVVSLLAWGLHYLVTYWNAPITPT